MIAEKTERSVQKGRSKVSSSYYLSTEALDQVDHTAERLGISKTAVLEMAIRILGERLWGKGDE